MGQNSTASFYKVFDVAENGKFEFVVPPDCVVVIAATADGYAVARSKLESTETEVGQITLPEGVSLKGILRDHDNQPLPNVVIHLVEKEALHLEHSAAIIRSSVLTDEKGRFRFPVHSGECTITVGDRGDNTFGESLIPDPMNQPLVLPKAINLDVNNPLAGIALSEAPPQNLSGRILLENGEPAIGIIVDAVVAGHQRVSRTQTDADGNYRTAVPQGAIGFGVRVLGKRDNEGGVLIGIPVEHPQSNRTTSQSIWFRDVEGDIDDINWTLRAPEYDETN